MPKRLPKDVDEQVLAQDANSPDGLGIEALSRLLGDQISRRSLQRRLSELVATRRLVSEKKGRSTRYLLRPSAGEVKREESTVALSPSGVEVSRKVWRPLAERTPVVYNREFLDKYRPNQSSYLTPETIAHLNRMGRTPDSEKPAGAYARHILDRLLVDLSWASSQLEGNTYSLLDTKRLIEQRRAGSLEVRMLLDQVDPAHRLLIFVNLTGRH